MKPAPSMVLGPALVVGFAAAVAMWSLGFIIRLPAVQASPLTVVAAFAITQVFAGWFTGRLAGGQARFRAAAAGGLVTGLLNLLLVGALVGDPTNVNALRGDWAVLVAAWLVGSPILSAIGALLAPSAPGRARDFHALFAVVAAAAVAPLLVIGGLVTSLKAGLTVPDWPNSFGYNMFLLPLAHMEGGIYFEHGHRLFGTLVGLTTMAFMVYTLLADRRGWVKALAVGAFVFVCVQGVLGGVRVTDAGLTTEGVPVATQTELSRDLALAFIHGVTGQMFFAFMCAMAAVCSARWKAGAPARASTPAGTPRLISAVLLLALLVQLCLGAAARHFTYTEGYMHALLTHVVNSVLVLAVAIGAGVRAAGAQTESRPLRILGKSLIHTVGLQMALGVAALWAVLTYRGAPQPPLVEVALATSHQAVGALLLALSAMLFAWSRRLVLPAAAPAGARAAAHA